LQKQTEQLLTKEKEILKLETEGVSGSANPE
jgi:hypothetical protein